MPTAIHLRTAVSLLVLSACGSPAIAPSTQSNEDAPQKRCLQIARIYRSEIVDDGTILFHMRDGTIWRNRLPRRCYGLRMQGGFGYVTPLDRLCDLDLIQVLEGSRSVCGLGRFEPYAAPESLDAHALDAAAPVDPPAEAAAGRASNEGDHP